MVTDLHLALLLLPHLRGLPVAVSYVGLLTKPSLTCEPVDHLQESLRPSGPETPEMSEKLPPGGTRRESGESFEIQSEKL